MYRLRAKKPAGGRLAKLTPPRAQGLVRRPRVIGAIDRALRGGVCWIAAPAGYGKTSAVLDYAARKRLRVLWYRVDEGDQDIASFFHHLAATIAQPAKQAPLPVFGPEYAEQPAEFARRFFRAWFARLPARPLLVLDDLHYADVAAFRQALAILLREMPEGLRCVCLSRTLVPAELREQSFRGRLALIEQRVLEFSEREARTLVSARRGRADDLDITAARGWAAGLVLLADRAGEGAGTAVARRTRGTAQVFAALARQMFEELGAAEQDALLKLSLLPEVTAPLAEQLTGSEAVRNVLVRLHQRQLLVTRSESTSAFRMHDLLREFLVARLAEQFSAEELLRLRERAALVLAANGQVSVAVGLALAARAWPLARRLIVQHAEELLAQGRRATLVEWCAALPDAELDARLCYWSGVAHMADDAAAERWFARAWSAFAAQADFAGQVLTAARAVLSKTESWRTHQGLSTWTGRLVELIEHDLVALNESDALLASAGMLRAVDFAPDYRTDSAAVRALVNRLLGFLATRGTNGSVNLRLMASQTLIDHAGSTGNAEVFEQAVDAVGANLEAAGVTPWVLGIWLVTFGAVTSRYFSYARRGFPYASAEEALRCAIAIGESESLPGVEFGALYHLQLLMKMRNDWSEFGAIIERVARIADSRYTTQVAVAADCEAALHTKQRRIPEAYQDCERFMAAIEAANEPPIERWPHFITKYQLLLADRKPFEAAEFLEGLLPLFDGAMRKRTQLCVRVARTLAAKWDGLAQYPQELRGCLHEMHSTGWSALLINLPEMLAELAADALEREIEPDYCAALIRRRHLSPPASRPAHWPWSHRIYLLGEFRIVAEGGPVQLGAKTPTRSLDLLRALAIARNQACVLADLYEWFWPDAEGDAAKAACEQALHRLRRLLGAPDPLVQRDGKLRLVPETVWVDLGSWEAQLAQALAPQADDQAEAAMRKAFDVFTGPLFQTESPGQWGLPAAERVRSKFLELAERLARRYEARRDFVGARAVYLRAIDMYPTSARGYEGLIRNRLALEDSAGALEDYQRYRRMLEAQGDAQATPAIRVLVNRLLRS